ncbi:MAG: S41 family peptidase [Chitinispirillia bacterium]|nr:S41 family peptidase [Chitinispirillia bacterium]MCL2268086.1 S41 family peptidase [Chitinispirillia bacterium]
MKFKIGLALTLSAVLFFACLYDVYDGDSDRLEEQQSVWQYLNVYSIFQERLPPAAGNLTPEDMFRAINDSLGGTRYTEYMDNRPGGGAIPPGNPIDTPIQLTDKTVYFYLDAFYSEGGKSFKVFADYLARFDNIIIDLRYNGGGLLSVCDAMLGEMLPNNTEYIQYHRRFYDSDALTGYTMIDKPRTSNRHPMLLNKNISVLVNGWSASASEIMAAGLKDKAGAYIIGSPTYGKGIGQVVITRPGRSRLSITSMEISGLTERTGKYHKIGLQPDEVPHEIYTVMDSIALLWAYELYPDHEGYQEALRIELRDIYCSIKLFEPDYMPSLPSDDGGWLIKKAGASLPSVVSRAAAMAERQANAERPVPVGVYEDIGDPLSEQ